MGSWIGRVVGIGVAVWGALMLVTTALTIAAPGDYGFEPVEVQAFGPGTMVVVRLVHIQDKKPVEGAVILESKTDMGPSGMGEMSGKVTATTSDQPGLYRFLIETGMAGSMRPALISRSASLCIASMSSGVGGPRWADLTMYMKRICELLLRRAAVGIAAELSRYFSRRNSPRRIDMGIA